MKEIVKYKAVLAGNFEEYKYFLSSIFPQDAQKLFIYINQTGTDKIRGLKFDCVITYGTFYERKDAFDLKEYVLERIY